MGLASKLQAAATTAPMSQLPPSSYAPTPSQYQAGQTSAYGQAPRPAQTYGQPSQYGQQPPSQYGQPQTSTYGQPQVPYGNKPPQQGQPYGQSQYGQPPSQYGQPPQSQYGQPPQSQYGQPQSQYGQPPQSQYGQPPQGQYGQPGQPQGQYGQPGQPQGQYGAPAPGGYGQPAYGGGMPGAGAQGILPLLQATVRDQHIDSFYNPQSLQQIASRPDIMPKIQDLAQKWRLNNEIALDMVKISLFDTIILVDDSGSMAFEENGERIEDMKVILGKIAFATSLFDHDGIQVRFLNSDIQGNNITSEAQVAGLIQQIRFSGLTPLGTSMERKVLEPLVLGPARSGQLQKPVLVITVTDGAPQGEDQNKIHQVLDRAKRELSQTRYGPDAVSFQFVQVGADMSARTFLAKLDADPQVGKYVDCTSGYEMEMDEMAKIGLGDSFTPEVYLMKLLLGSIDSSYDTKDEASHPPVRY